MTANSGSGSEQISIQANGTNDVAVTGGRGNDTIRVFARRSGTTEVLGDQGRDRTNVTVSRETETNIDGGRGRDSVRVTGQGRSNQNPVDQGSPDPDSTRDERRCRERRGHQRDSLDEAKLSRHLDASFNQLGRDRRR